MEPSLTAYAQHETERLTIRPLSSGEAAALQRLTDDPAITSRIIFLSSPFTLSDAEALIGRNDRENCFLGVWQNEALIGVVGAHLRGSDQLEIGYWLGTHFHRRGYAAEAVSAVLAKLRQLSRAPDHRSVQAGQCPFLEPPAQAQLPARGRAGGPARARIAHAR